MGSTGILSISISKIGNKLFCVSQPSNLVDINKYILRCRPLSNYFLLSRECTRVSMYKWKYSMAKTQESRQYWNFERRTHKSHAHGHDNNKSNGKLGAHGEKILRWGLWSDIILTISKVVAGYISGSTAIIADAAHSISDIGLSGVALWCSKASKALLDQKHPYGYGKIESMGAFGISSLLLMTGGGIAWTAIDALQVLTLGISTNQDTSMQATIDPRVHQDIHNHGRNHEHNIVAHKHVFDVEHMEIALLAAIVGIGVKESLYWITKAIGEKSGSALLKANAWHHRVDVTSTIVALIGIVGAMMGMPFLDPGAALLVSGMIIKIGLEYGYQSMQELLDKGLPQTSLAPIHKTILQVDGVKGIHQLMGRRMGSIVEVDVHIKVDPLLSVSGAHTIGRALRQQIQIHHPNISKVLVHIANEQSSLSNRSEKDKSSHKDDEYLYAIKHSQENHVKDILESMHFYGHQNCQHKHLHDHNNKNHHNGHSYGYNYNLGKNDDDGVRRKDEHIKDLNRVGQKILIEIQAKFGEVVKVRTVTCQLLQGKVVAEVGISAVDPDISVRDAMRHASEMEAYIMTQNAEDLAAVSVQLHLSSGRR